VGPAPSGGDRGPDPSKEMFFFSSPSSLNNVYSFSSKITEILAILE